MFLPPPLSLLYFTQFAVQYCTECTFKKMLIATKGTTNYDVSFFLHKTACLSVMPVLAGIIFSQGRTLTNLFFFLWAVKSFPLSEISRIADADLNIALWPSYLVELCKIKRRAYSNRSRFFDWLVSLEEEASVTLSPHPLFNANKGLLLALKRRWSPQV